MGNNTVIKVAMLLMAGCIVSCNKPIKNKQALVEYLNESKHNLKKKQEVNKITVGVTFKPWQLMAANINSSKKQKDAILIKNMQSKFYFVLSLSANGKEMLRQLPYAQYSEMVQVLSFRMRQYVSIVTDADKVVEAEDCLFQQTYGMARENELLLVFNKASLENVRILNLRIKEFGLNTGNLNFQIKMNDIKNVPSINL